MYSKILSFLFHKYLIYFYLLLVTITITITIIDIMI